jgi:hypothetical protein
MNPALNPPSPFFQNISSIFSTSCSKSTMLGLNPKPSSSNNPDTKISVILAGPKQNPDFLTQSDLYKNINPINSVKTIEDLKTLIKPKRSGYYLNYVHKTYLGKPKTVKNSSKNSKSIEKLEKNNIFPEEPFENSKMRSFSSLQPDNKMRNKHVKRKERCDHDDEIVSVEKYSGILKKYHLKARYGFIKSDSKKVFLCEDELVLSGINLKKFKDCVFNKIPICLEFKLKSFAHNGKEILSATQIQVR